MHLTPSSTKFKLWISAVVVTYWPTLPQEWRVSAVKKKNSFKERLREGERVMYTRNSDFCAYGAVRSYGSAQQLISWLYRSSSFSRKSSHRCYICMGIRIQWRVSRYIDSDGLIYRTAWIFRKLLTRHLSIRLQEANQSWYKEERKVYCIFATN